MGLPRVVDAAVRSRVRSLLLDHAERDDRIAAAALVGSTASGQEDEWSDVDVALGLADGADRPAVVRDWTALLEDELGAVHHWDLESRASLFRVFLLPDGLEVDLSFTPADCFGSYGAAFALVFGSARELPPGPPPDARRLVGLAWHHALHARKALARGKPWQALHLVSALRDHVLELACARLSLPAAAGKGFDAVPEELRRRLEPAAATSLDPERLGRSLAAAVDALLEEVAELDARLADALRRALA